MFTSTPALTRLVIQPRRFALALFLTTKKLAASRRRLSSELRASAMFFSARSIRASTFSKTWSCNRGLAQSRRRRSLAGTPKSAEASVTLQPWRARAPTTASRSRPATVAGRPVIFDPSSASKALIMLVYGVLAGDDDAATKLGLEMETPVELLTLPRIKPGRRRGGQTGNNPRSMIPSPIRRRYQRNPIEKTPSPKTGITRQLTPLIKPQRPTPMSARADEKAPTAPIRPMKMRYRNDEGKVAKRDGRRRGPGGYLPRRPHPRNAHRREIINRSPHAQEINPRAENAQTQGSAIK